MERQVLWGPPNYKHLARWGEELVLYFELNTPMKILSGRLRRKLIAIPHTKVSTCQGLAGVGTGDPQ